MADQNSTLNLRADFPLLAQKIKGKNLVYLDSAATSLKPWPVIERIGHFYTYETANIHRGAHYLADRATLNYEETRKSVQEFIGAKDADEIVFTKGTTESINLVAQTWGEQYLNSGDEILVSEMEHHANLVPWQMIAQKKKAKVQAFTFDHSGNLSFEDFKNKLSSRTKILALTHCSNTLGTINEIEKYIQEAKKIGAMVLIDGAQYVANRKVDVQNLNCDFYVFSAHKLFGPYGLGILYGKKEILNQMPPYQGGGNMISDVSIESSTYNQLPYKFEAGTPSIAEVIAFKSSIEYVQKIGWNKIESHENELLQYATSQLKNIDGLEIFGEAKNKTAIISFLIQGLHHADIGQILDQENVAVRVGHHCTLPLMKKLKIKGTVRASFSIYNNKSDVDAFIAAVKKAKEMLS